MMLVPLQLSTVHHPSYDGLCTCWWREKRECEKRVWSTKHSKGKTKCRL